MKARVFFQQVLRAEKELKILRAKVRHYEELGLTITSNVSAVGGRQQGSSKVEMAAVGTVDAARDLQKQIDEYTALVAKAEKIVEEIHQEKYREILKYKYFCGWSFRSISDEIGYKDPNSIYRAHGWALYEAQKILDQKKD